MYLNRSTALLIAVFVFMGGQARADHNMGALKLDFVNGSYTSPILFVFKNPNGEVTFQAEEIHGKGGWVITYGRSITVIAYAKRNGRWARVARNTYSPSVGAPHNRYANKALKRKNGRTGPYYLTDPR